MKLLRHFLVFFVATLTISLITASKTQALTTITASGDYDDTANTASVIDAIGATNPNVHLALGDFSYGNNADAGQEAAWCNFVNTRLTNQGINTSTFPFQLLSGNHEDDAQLNGFIGDFAACLPDRMSSTGAYGAHYYFDHDNIRVIMLSPNLSINSTDYAYTVGSPEYTEVSNWIDAGRAASKDWIIVGIHENCLTVGKKPDCEIGADIMDLLITKQVDLILHGHDHTYQRSKQLKLGTGCTSLVHNGYDTDCHNPARPANVYTKGAGPVDITVATGGRDLYNVNHMDPEKNYFLRASGANASPSYGNLKLVIDGTELRGSFEAATGSYHDEFLITSSAQVLTPQNRSAHDLIGDFNGDGRDDIAYARTMGSTVTWRVGASTGSSFSYDGVWNTDFGDNGDSYYAADFTGDGRDDIAYSRVVDSNTVLWRVARSTGSGFVNTGIWRADLGIGASQFFVGDFNADSRSDVAYMNQSGDTLQWRVALSTGKAFNYNGAWSNDLGDASDRFLVGDFTGDGRDDIAYMRPTSGTSVTWRLGRSTGHGFTYYNIWQSSMGDADDTFKKGDFNGDGRDDILYGRLDNFTMLPIKLSLSSGGRFAMATTVMGDFGNDGDTLRIGDFDGDGVAELVRARAESTTTLDWRVASPYPAFVDHGTWSNDLGDPTDAY